MVNSADSLGLPFLSAYLDSVGSNFSHGANYAASGAEILPPYTSGYNPFTLDVQLHQFLQFKSSSQLVYKQGGILKDLVPKEEYFSQALYTLDIGQNDLTAKPFLNRSADEFILGALKLFAKVIKMYQHRVYMMRVGGISGFTTQVALVAFYMFSST